MSVSLSSSGALRGLDDDPGVQAAARHQELLAAAWTECRCKLMATDGATVGRGMLRAEMVLVLALHTAVIIRFYPRLFPSVFHELL